jgi:hypothetical protein
MSIYRHAKRTELIERHAALEAIREGLKVVAFQSTLHTESAEVGLATARLFLKRDLAAVTAELARRDEMMPDLTDAPSLTLIAS